MIDAGRAPGDWRGEFSDGVTAAVYQVTLTLEGDVLVGRRVGFGEFAQLAQLGDDGSVFHWPVDRIRTESLGDGRRVARSRDVEGANLTVTEHVAAVFGLVEGFGKQRASRLRLLLLYGAGCVAAAALLYSAATPLSRMVAGQIPQSAEAALGQELGLLLKSSYCETSAASETLRELARRLGAGPQVTVHVLDASLVNAFTLPGGVVVVSRGLISEAEGPDELAGVMAHEIEHVARRHVLVRVVRTSLLAALWQVSIGDFSGLLVIDPKTAFDVATLRFSRDDEREADVGALARLDRAGIARTGFRQFFTRMKEKTDAMPAWLSSHPSSAERAEAGSDVLSAPTAALDATSWQTLREGCPTKTPEKTSAEKPPPEKP